MLTRNDCGQTATLACVVGLLFGLNVGNADDPKCNSVPVAVFVRVVVAAATGDLCIVHRCDRPESILRERLETTQAKSGGLHGAVTRQGWVDMAVPSGVDDRLCRRPG